MAQLGSALAWGARGRWFKSSRPEFYLTKSILYPKFPQKEGVLRKQISMLLAGAYAIADSIGVFVFVFSTIGHLEALVTFFALFYITYDNEFKGINSFLSVVFTAPETWYQFFYDLRKNNILSIIFPIIALFFGFYYTGFVLASQFYTTFLFISSQISLSWLITPLILLIVFPAAIANYIKFVRESNKVPTLISFYASTMYPKGTAKSTAKLVMAWAFKIITLIGGIWLSIIVACLINHLFLCCTTRCTFSIV